MPKFRFNHVTNPDYVLIHSIINKFLPEMGTREIKVSLSIIFESEQDLRNKARVVANYWLYSEGPALVINLDEPNRYYLAEVQSANDLFEILCLGSAEITFFCVDLT